MQEQLPDDGDDVELVLIEQDEYETEPQTELGKTVDTVSTSLWIRSDDREFPVFSHSEYGCWNFPESDFNYNVNRDTVSEAFIEGVAHIPDEEYNGLIGFDEETFYEMSDAEKVIAHSIREGFAEPRQRAKPKLIVFKICRDKLGLE